MKKEIRSDLTSKNKITDSINIVSKAVLAYEREPQKTETTGGYKNERSSCCKWSKTSSRKLWWKLKGYHSNRYGSYGS